MGVDRPLIRSERHPVDRVEQLTAGKHPPGLAYQRAQELELGSRQVHAQATHRPPASAARRLDVGSAEHLGANEARLGPRSTERTLATSSLRAERLHEVVVRPQLEAGDLVRLIACAVSITMGRFDARPILLVTSSPARALAGRGRGPRGPDACPARFESAASPSPATATSNPAPPARRYRGRDPHLILDHQDPLHRSLQPADEKGRRQAPPPLTPRRRSGGRRLFAGWRALSVLPAVPFLALASNRSRPSVLQGPCPGPHPGPPPRPRERPAEQEEDPKEEEQFEQASRREEPVSDPCS